MVTITMSREALEALDALARSQGQTRSAMVEELVMAETKKGERR
jgi:hypothetical protein